MNLAALSVAFICSLCACPQQGRAIRIPVEAIERQQPGVCPAEVRLDEARRNTTQAYMSALRGSANSFTCPCGGTGQWSRIAHLDMSDTSQACPSNWRLNTAPERTCHRSASNSDVAQSCDSVFYPSGDLAYQQICGRVIGYQKGDSAGFVGIVRNGRLLDEAYVSGVSITHGTSRQHIWSFAMTSTNSATANGFLRSCPCTDPGADIESSFMHPFFIGDDYFCDTGNFGVRDNPTFFDGNPVWDGVGCMGDNVCCEFNTPPWFCKEIPQPTTDPLEIRICNQQMEVHEDAHVRLIEIYVR